MPGLVHWTPKRKTPEPGRRAVLPLPRNRKSEIALFPLAQASGHSVSLNLSQALTIDIYYRSFSTKSIYLLPRFRPDFTSGKKPFSLPRMIAAEPGDSSATAFVHARRPSGQSSLSTARNRHRAARLWRRVVEILLPRVKTSRRQNSGEIKTIPGELGRTWRAWGVSPRRTVIPIGKIGASAPGASRDVNQPDHRPSTDGFHVD